MAGVLFYPGAGYDWLEPISAFGDRIDCFVFVDPMYPKGLRLPPAVRDQWQLLTQRIEGDPNANIEVRVDDRGEQHRFLEPSVLVEEYQRLDGRNIVVRRRRGFGQYAIEKELRSAALDVFFFRGDNPVVGEASSGVRYIANSNRRHAPLSRLWDQLSKKFANTALVVTDGSNANPAFLRKYSHTSLSGKEAARLERDKIHTWGGWHWQCVGHVGPKYGPTLLWQISRVAE